MCYERLESGNRNLEIEIILTHAGPAGLAQIEKITQEEFEAIENDCHPLGKSSIIRPSKQIYKILNFTLKF